MQTEQKNNTTVNISVLFITEYERYRNQLISNIASLGKFGMVCKVEIFDEKCFKFPEISCFQNSEILILGHNNFSEIFDFFKTYSEVFTKYIPQIVLFNTSFDDAELFEIFKITNLLAVIDSLSFQPSKLFLLFKNALKIIPIYFEQFPENKIVTNFVLQPEHYYFNFFSVLPYSAMLFAADNISDYNLLNINDKALNLLNLKKSKNLLSDIKHIFYNWGIEIETIFKKIIVENEIFSQTVSLSQQNLFVELIGLNIGNNSIALIINDITKELLIQKSLKESNELFRAFAENSPDVIMRFDSQHRHLYVNPVTAKKTGIPALNFIGKTHKELDFPEQLSLFWEEKLDLVFQTKENQRVEFMLPNNTWFDWLVVPEFDENNNVSSIISSARDITNFKNTEFELIKNNNLLLTLLNTIPNPFFYKDSSGRYIGYNQSFIDFFNSQPNQILNFTENEFFQQIGAKTIRETIVHKSPKKGVNVTEKLISLADGTQKSLLIFINRHSNNNIVGIIHDNTYIKNIEAEKLKQEELYKLLAENLRDTIWLLDEDAHFVYLSPSIERFTGYTVEEYVKLPLNKQIASSSFNYVEKLLVEYQQIFRSGKLEKQMEHKFQIDLLNKEGNVINSEIKISAFVVNDKVSAILGIMRNITARLKAQKLLVESELKFRNFFAYSNVGMVITDLKGNFINVNNEFCKILGYKEEELLKMRFHDISHLEDLEKDLKELQKVLDGKTNSFQIEKRYLKKNGEYVWVGLNGTTLTNAKGEIYNLIAQIQDITDIKLYEKTLKTLSAAIQQSLVSILITNPEGKIEYVNQQYTHATGYTFHEILGRFPIFFTFYAENNETIWEYLKRNGSWKGELQINRKEGTFIWELISVSAVYDKMGDISNYIVVKEDITDRKKTEIALFESRERYWKLSSHSPIGILFADTKGNILELNNRILEIFRLSSVKDAKKINLLNFHYLIDVGFANDFNKCVQQQIQVKNSQNFLSIGGERVYISYYLTPVNDAHNNISGVIVNFEDLTSKFYAEQKQNEYLAELQLLSDSATVLMELETEDEIFEYMGNTIAKIARDTIIFISFVNNETEEILVSKHFGICENELNILAQAIKTKPTEIRIKLNENIKQAFSKLKIQKLNTTFNNFTENFFSDSSYNFLKDSFLIDSVFCVGIGRNETVYAGMFIFAKSEEIILQKIRFLESFLFQVSLVIHRKQLEKKLLLSIDKAEQANRAKSMFLATMSHEIRTPMNAIIGFSEILKTNIGSDTKYSKYVKGIESGAHALLNLINDVLDISKIEAGQLQINNTETKIANIVVEIEQIFKMKLKEKGLFFETSFAENFPDYVLIDENRIRQILLNLIGNAIKFTQNGGITVNFSTENYRLDLKHVKIICVVSDTGEGIPEDKFHTIFEPFIQLQNIKNLKHNGTGLGLSITKKLLNMMNGEIEVSSTLMKGSSFKITLNNVQVLEHKTNNNISSEVDFHNFIFQQSKVLIAEDIESNIDVIRGYLQETNIILFQALNGKEAVEQAAIINPDLILMDINMPIMNGLEASKILKSDNSFKNIPIVALTAYAVKDQQIDIMKICDDYLSKPITKINLFKTLAKYLKTIHIDDKKQNALKYSPEDFMNLYQIFPVEFALTWDTKILKLYEESCISLSFKIIKKFAEEILNLENSFHAPILKQVGNELISAVKNFNTVAIDKNLQIFAKLLEVMKKN